MGMVSLDNSFPARSSNTNSVRLKGSRTAGSRVTAPDWYSSAKRKKKRTKKTQSYTAPAEEEYPPSKPGDQSPRTQTTAAPEIPGPKPPTVAMDLTKLGPSPEVERKQALSSALLKSAAFVQPSSISGSLQGLLSGAGIGTEIDAAMQQYRERKRAAAESSRAQAEAPSQSPPMRKNYNDVM